MQNGARFTKVRFQTRVKFCRKLIPDVITLSNNYMETSTLAQLQHLKNVLNTK